MPFDTQSEQSDEALLARYASGDRMASRLLAARLLPRVLAHATRVLGDPTEAEDVAQEAMLRLWRIAPEWRSGEARVTTWLYQVTANLCTDRRRRRRGVGLDEVAEPVDPACDPLTRLQEQDRVTALQDALNSLPERQRQALVLRHLDELGNPEIGRIMGVNIRAVESLTARGKRALVALLAGRRAELGFEDDDR